MSYEVLCDKLGRRPRARCDRGNSWGAQELEVEALPCLSAKSTTGGQLKHSRADKTTEHIDDEVDSRKLQSRKTCGMRCNGESNSPRHSVQKERPVKAPDAGEVPDPSAQRAY